MSDGITDGTHQMTPPVIDVTRTTNHKNYFADTIIYQVFATLNGVSTQIFETDNKDKAQQFVDVINGNTFLTKLQATIKPKYVNHAVIEDGYYTYSHIYENGQTINFTIYNSPITYNTADVINGWMGYILKFTSQVSHWWYDNHAYAYSSDGTLDFLTTFPNFNLLTGTKDFSGNWINSEPWYHNGAFNGMGVMSFNEGANIGIVQKFVVPEDGFYTMSMFCKVMDGSLGDFIIEASSHPVVLEVIQPTEFKRVSYSGMYSKDDVILMYFRFDGSSTPTKDGISIAGQKIEHGKTLTHYIPTQSEMQPGDGPTFIGTQHTPIEYLHDDPKWYDWQPFTGIEPVENTHTIFDYKVQITDEVEEVKQTAPINKRNIRNDNWKYAPNEKYPFIGGYES